MKKAVDDVALACEESFRTVSVEAAEGLLVEGGGFHEATGGELVDDEFDEAYLWGVEAAVFEEGGEGCFGGVAVHADDTADEVCQRGHFVELDHTCEQALAFVFTDA